MVVQHARWLALLGDYAYMTALGSTVFNAARRALGLPYWSLSQWLKLKVKNAVSYIGEYERTLIAEAHRHAVQGVICGHIHHATMREDRRHFVTSIAATGLKAAPPLPRTSTAVRDHRLGEHVADSAASGGAVDRGRAAGGMRLKPPVYFPPGSMGGLDPPD